MTFAFTANPVQGFDDCTLNFDQIAESIGGQGLGLLDITAAPYGVVPGSGADVTATINRALIDAGLLGTGVFFPPGDYQVTTLFMQINSSLVGPDIGMAMDRGGVGGVRLIGNPAFPMVSLPNNGSGVFFEPCGCSLRNLNLLAGQDGIVAPNGADGFTIEHVFIEVTRYAIAPTGSCQEWDVEGLEISGGTIGFYQPNLPGVGGDTSRLDKCVFDQVYFHGQTVNAINVDFVFSSSVTWRDLRTLIIGKDCIVLAGACVGWNFEGWNTEGVGFADPKIAPTTGSMAAGTNTCTVASTAGMVGGGVQTVTVQGAGGVGAGVGEFDLYATITSIAGLVLTLSSNALSSVTNAEVTTAEASDLRCVSNARGTPTLRIRGYDSGAGFSPTSQARYSLDLSGCGYASVEGRVSRDIYDPFNAGIYPAHASGLLIFRPVPGSPGQWTPLALNAGWSSGGVTPAWRRDGDLVFLMGNVVAAAGAGTTIASLHPRAQPTSIRLFNQVTSGLLQIGAGGLLTGWNAPGNVVFLEGLVYRLS